jgi:hypothetical protein
MTLGRVMDQATGKVVPYDPYRVSHTLQSSILSYYEDPPRRDTGETKWLTVVAPRQIGKSLCAELSAYFLTSMYGGLDHLCLADNQFRADYLHRRIQLAHNALPPGLRPKTLAHNESRKLSFANGSMMRAASAKQKAVAVGQSPDSLHASELGFWDDPSNQMSLLLPAMINRRESRAVFECTPVTSSEPGFEWWRDHCLAASRGKGRSLYCFVPYWDSKLNARPWPKSQQPSSEELVMLNKYSEQGLTLDNLMFRRLMMDSDPEIRRNPSLFDVFYPSNDVECWLQIGTSIITSEHLSAREHRLDAPNGRDYQEFESYDPEGVYLMGVDPSGYGQDHSSFVVFRLWADEWLQVAEFSSGDVAPLEFYREMLKTAEKYDAYVAVERNGVGIGALTFLQERGYRKVMVGKDAKPGFVKTSEELHVNAVIDALLDTLTLRSATLYKQLASYRNDRAQSRGSRRSRHHWDLVSALSLVCLMAPQLPMRYRRAAPNVVPISSAMSLRQKEEWLAQVSKDSKKPSRRRRRRRR